MSMFNSINISASALTAEKTRIDIINKNIANANTERTSGGAPYRRQITVFEENKGTSFSRVLGKYTGGNQVGGVKLGKVVEDETPFKLKYDPGNPNANEDGYVEMSNVERVTEMVDLISAQRSYDANITAMNASKSMLMKALEIGRR